MKVFIAVAVISILSTGVNAAPVATCGLQKGCISWTIERVNPEVCDPNAACELRVCMNVNTALPSCAKAGDTISHVCDKGDANDPVSASWNKKENVATDSFCQVGYPGQSLSFIVKDGSDKTLDTVKTTSTIKVCDIDVPVTCQQVNAAAIRPCGGGKNKLMERVWTITIPDPFSLKCNIKCFFDMVPQTFPAQITEMCEPILKSLETPMITVSVRVFLTAPPTPNVFQYIVAKGKFGCNYASYALYFDGGDSQLKFYIADSTGVVVKSPGYSSSSLVLNQWYHIVGTFDGSSVNLFVDGELVVPPTPQTSNKIDYNTATGPLTIGYYDCNGTPLQLSGATLAKLCFFDKALNVNEVVALDNMCH